MAIPLFDCRVDEAAIAAMTPVLASGQLASGAHVGALESDLSARLSGRPVVALSDMTQAIELALRLAGIGPGDEVLTLSYNCMSSNSAIRNVGASAVWVDIDPATATMDVGHARSQITPATRAIIVYHVAGYPADAAALRALSDEAGLVLIEDANAALGASLPDGRAVGTIGDFAIFSFYASRQVNAIEGAALLCRDEEDAARARRLRRFGIDQGRFRDPLGEIDPRADIAEIGLAATLPNVNAALARHNLELLDARQHSVRANAAVMTTALEHIAGVEAVRPLTGTFPAFWGLLLLCDERDDLLATLKEKGIGSSKLHQPNHVYSGFGSRAAALPGTDMFIDRILAIPVGWWIGAAERQQIVDTIAGALRK
ncbi:DegT/DnrJ/EryC1/StrS family aminotransferase [Sphingopyxis granuli]|uniref:DegT/DnrJ/EryC1/StrS family aminotransferase n=1 Tax=Sphingopyxis granuli TaxID=267128 RepID=UPI00082D2E56|nr:DegT/DnrJ/EryC1/StrS family aminotransferase [Sphingopyxis granuli]